MVLFASRRRLVSEGLGFSKCGNLLDSISLVKEPSALSNLRRLEALVGASFEVLLLEEFAEALAL